jgi:hypothetical protein
MTKFKLVGAALILSAAIATPVFAQGTAVAAQHHHRQGFRGAYNQSNALYAAPMTNEECRNLENFGFSGRDPSRVSGESPNLNPAS